MRKPLLSLTLVLISCASSPPSPGVGGGAGGSAGGGVATGGGAGGAGGFGGAGGGSDLTDALIGARPYNRTIPPSYDGGTPTPLMVLVHGYTATGATQDLYLGMSTLAREKGFLLALPDGLTDGAGSHFWNATDACCNFYNSPVDDVAYLTAVIDDMKRRYVVDPKRVFLFGHSNGAFMSNRMACERADRIAAIVSLAGAVWADASLCAPSEPVAVLQVHGTADAVVAYNGGTVLPGRPQFPSAKVTSATWASKNGCLVGPGDAGPPIDIDTPLLGNETTREAYSGCNPGGAAELWSITLGSHTPAFNGDAMDTMWDWLQAHPKP